MGGPSRKNSYKIPKKTLGFLRRNLWFCPTEVKVTAYKSLVRPILEYATCAWDPYKVGQIKKLEGVQRKAARFCLGNYNRESSVTEMLTELQLEKLAKRREQNRLSMMYKIQENIVDIKKDEHIKITASRKTRSSHAKNIEIPFARTEAYKNSYFPRTSRDWNLLEKSKVAAPSLESFKRAL